MDGMFVLKLSMLQARLPDLQVDIINAAGNEQAQLSSEFQTAISSRHAVHPAHPILAAGTASGRMHIYR